MLVLTRSIGQKIYINGEEIKIQIIQVKGNQVRLGIEAPEQISINREEVHYAKKNNPRDPLKTENFNPSKTPTIIFKKPKRVIKNENYG